MHPQSHSNDRPSLPSISYAIAQLQPTEGAWAEAKAKAELGHGWKKAGRGISGGEA